MGQYRGREHELFKSTCDKYDVDPREVPEPELTAPGPKPSERLRQSRGRSAQRSASRHQEGPGGPWPHSRPPPAYRGPFLTCSSERFSWAGRAQGAP
eukprot:9498703-Alexandrium_andersonii.AAC.1